MTNPAHKWTRKNATAGDLSYGPHYYLVASRSAHDKAQGWNVYDHRTNPEWLDDRLTYGDTLAEAKEIVERLAAGGELTTRERVRKN